MEHNNVFTCQLESGEPDRISVFLCVFYFLHISFPAGLPSKNLCCYFNR